MKVSSRAKLSDRLWCPQTVWLNGLLTYFLLSLVTPWSRVLLEKLTGSPLVKKFPALYGTRRFITAVKKCPPPVPILNQFDSVHNPHFLLHDDPS